MKHIRIEENRPIQHIYLDRGKSNAMDSVLIKELTTALLEADSRPDLEGIVLHGKEGFFSSGLDLVALYAYNEKEIEDLWNSFFSLIETFLRFSKPAISAISGHSPAGGCVLALCCDYRMMAEGEYVIGLNEVPVGLVVPQSIFALYAFWIGEAKAYKSLLTGKLYSPQDALADRLIDEIVDSRRLFRLSEQRLNNFTQFEKNAWRKSKRNFRQDLIQSFQENREKAIKDILEQWWKPSTREVMHILIENLNSKKQQ